jgi:hypothetical protein
LHKPRQHLLPGVHFCGSQWPVGNFEEMLSTGNTGGAQAPAQHSAACGGSHVGRLVVSPLGWNKSASLQIFAAEACDYLGEQRSLWSVILLHNHVNET